MESWLFNLVQKLTQVKNTLLSTGPGVLRKGADALSLLESAARQAADYIDLINPYTVLGAGNVQGYSGDTPEAKDYLDQLESIKKELVQAYTSPPAALRTQGPPVAEMSLLPTAIVSPLISIAITLIEKILLKSGRSPHAAVAVESVPKHNLTKK